MKTPWMVLIGSIVLVGGLAALLLWKGEPDKPEPLILQCAAALREPIEAIVPIYEEQTGQRIEVRYGESQKVLTDLELTKQGDLFLPADDSYIADAQKKGLLGEVLPIATMNATLVVRADDPATIVKWDDLLSKDVNVAIANPEAAAITRLLRTHLGSRWQPLHERAIALGPVTQVANAVKIDRNIHAGIIWDSMVESPNYKGHLRKVPLKELEGIQATVKIGVVKGSKRYDAAMDFARHLATSHAELQRHGFTPINTAAPVQSEKVAGAEIVLYCGAMLQPAIEQTIKEFEKREGVKVTRVYNGCGILVSQMNAITAKEKSDQFPDVYFSCDTTFMSQVEKHFDKPRIVSKNDLVIAVKKGNPHGIKSLKDLGKEGLRVGVGHEQQCALGVITRGVLIRNRVLKAVEQNVVERAPSGDLLVNQLRTGSLDAVVAYVSNVKPYERDLDAIRGEELSCEPAQPIAVSLTTRHREAAKRLIRAIESAESKERFEKLGFGWEVKP